MKSFQASFTIVGKSSLQFNKAFPDEKETGELHKDFEERIWRERAHKTEEGQLYIPGMAVKNMLSLAARYLSESVSGKGKSTYTKHFEAGVMVNDDFMLDSSIKDIEGQWIYVPSTGKKGDSTRVWKCFPVLRQWKATGSLLCFDPVIDDKIMEKYLNQSGVFIGLLSWRPRNGGQNGRFSIENFKYKKVDI